MFASAAAAASAAGLHPRLVTWIRERTRHRPINEANYETDELALGRRAAFRRRSANDRSIGSIRGIPDEDDPATRRGARRSLAPDCAPLIKSHLRTDERDFWTDATEMRETEFSLSLSLSLFADIMYNVSYSQ